MRISILTTLLIFLASFDLHATVLGGVAVDATDDSPLPACAVALLPVGQSVQTDIDGRFAFKVKPGEYIIKASYVGFDDYETIIKIGKRDTSVVLRLQPKSEQLRDVVITAKESTGVTSSSRIDKDAMTHLQPSSFSDLLELLPGNISQNPEMGTVNSIKLRETGNIGATGTLADNADYAMSALGTAFNVDGAPVNNDANLQSVGIESATGRNAVNRGVDMRSLSTDNIESVEIVRGIPSAEYGNLSSGLVNIRRTRRATPLSARFKADGYSKLFYVGKGIAIGPQRRNTLNADLGWLDSKTDPRNKLENYKRITASVRTALNWQNQYTLCEWNLAADYTGTVDNAKTDPDLSLNKIDEYQANNHRVALTSDFSVSFLRIPALKRIDFKASASYQNDRLKRRRQVSPGLGAVAPITNTEGVHDGIYILEEYIAEYLSEGKPLSLFAKLGLTGAIPSWSGSNQTYKAGVEWNMSKNYGRGWTCSTRAHCAINPSISAGEGPMVMMPTYIKVEPGHEVETRDIVRQTIDSLCDASNITADEIRSIREFLVKNHAEVATDNAYWLKVIKSYERDGLDIESEYDAAVGRITPESVADFGRRVVKPANKASIIMSAEKN